MLIIAWLAIWSHGSLAEIASQNFCSFAIASLRVVAQDPLPGERRADRSAGRAGQRDDLDVVREIPEQALQHPGGERRVAAAALTGDRDSIT